MEIKILGYKLRVEILILLFIVFLIMTNHLFCSCSKYTFTEGMQLMGAELGYKMGNGIKDSWDTRQQKEGSSLKWRSQDHDSYDSKMVMPDDNINFFASTEFSPDCCGSTYSSSGGCACLNKEQITYLNQRGGNRTHVDTF